eukprot:7700986-Pyramimonas_sp.AAC.1
MSDNCWARDWSDTRRKRPAALFSDGCRARSMASAEKTGFAVHDQLGRYSVAPLPPQPAKLIC